MPLTAARTTASDSRTTSRVVLRGRLPDPNGETAQHGQVGDLGRQALLYPLGSDPRPEVWIDDHGLRPDSQRLIAPHPRSLY